MEKTYIVTWDEKWLRKEHGYITRVVAKSPKDARRIAEAWQSSHHRVGKTPHMFHVKVTVEKPGTETLSARTWIIAGKSWGEHR